MGWDGERKRMTWFVLGEERAYWSQTSCGYDVFQHYNMFGKGLGLCRGV